VLTADDLAAVGGAEGEQAAIKLSVTVSWGGNCNCCRGTRGIDA